MEFLKIERAFIISRLNNEIDDKEILNHKEDRPSTLDFLRFDYNSDDLLRIEADKAQLNNTISREQMWKINKESRLILIQSLIQLLVIWIEATLPLCLNMMDQGEYL